MKPVSRAEILDHVTYAEQRETLRPEAMAAKAVRRVHVGDAFTFLFENRETVRYQVHEMVHVEKIVREADILHELETYNELLGGQGELGCTLLIAIEDEVERAFKLRAWMGLLEHVFIRLDDGQQVRASWDPRQVGDDRLSSVQYLKFAVGRAVPVGVGFDHPEVKEEARFDSDQSAALAADLADLN